MLVTRHMEHDRKLGLRGAGAYVECAMPCLDKCSRHNPSLLSKRKSAQHSWLNAKQVLDKADDRASQQLAQKRATLDAQLNVGAATLIRLQAATIACAHSAA